MRLSYFLYSSIFFCFARLECFFLCLANFKFSDLVRSEKLVTVSLGVYPSQQFCTLTMVTNYNSTLQSCMHRKPYLVSCLDNSIFCMRSSFELRARIFCHSFTNEVRTRHLRLTSAQGASVSSRCLPLPYS